VHPDIVLVDLDMPVMNGVQLNDLLHREFPAIKVIILSVHNQERFISKMIDAGANGYLAKNCDIEELISAIKIVHRSGFYFNNDCLSALKNAAAHRNKKLKNINNIPFEITSREQEILLLLCKEYTTAEIAEKLFLSSRTVEGHRNNLLTKIGCRNTAGIIIFAIRNGLYEPWLS
jgi:DNA-binding NarL/FixJ family response regulator